MIATIRLIDLILVEIMWKTLRSQKNRKVKK